MKRFTSLRGVGASDLTELIEASLRHATRLERHQPGGDELAGLAVATMFFEPSTRTRLSFELAARRLGADVLTLDPANSSRVKGESLRDTAMTVAAIGADILVVRHGEDGAPDRVADWTGRPVVNAGDGTREHPTQGLLDAVTLVRHFDRLDGLAMGIVGDVRHSRVAGSLVHAMPQLGVDVVLVGPEGFLPDVDDIAAQTSSSFDELLPDLDVVYLLRVQRERGAATTADFKALFQLNETRAAAMKPGAVVMHAGPINRGVEVANSVADGPRSLILRQVANGVPARMAVLAALGREVK